MLKAKIGEKVTQSLVSVCVIRFITDQFYLKKN